MTQLLEKAFEEIESLPKDEQDAFAAFILNEITTEQRWKEHFEDAEGELEELADQALEEHQRGEIDLLNPENL